MNVPAIAQYCFRNVDPDFVARAKAAGAGVIVGGELYGQGSSREAAVLSPLHLGVRAVVGEELRAHPSREPDQLGYRAARVRRPGRPRSDRSATPRSGSKGCAAPWPRVAERRSSTRGTGGRFQVRCVVTPRERDILLAGGSVGPDGRGGQAMTRAPGSRAAHARRHRPLPRLPREGPAARPASSATRSCSPPSGALIRTAASSTGRVAASPRSPRPTSWAHRAIRMPGGLRLAQVEVSKPVEDYTGNCGNCSSSVGPFAIDERLVPLHRGRDRGPDPQHQHEEAHRGPRARRRRRGSRRGRLRAAGRGRARRADRARLRRSGRRGDGRLLPTGKARDAVDGVGGIPAWTPPIPWSSSAPRISASPARKRPQAIDADRDLRARWRESAPPPRR